MADKGRARYTGTELKRPIMCYVFEKQALRPLGDHCSPLWVYQMLHQIACQNGCKVTLVAFIWLFYTVRFQMCPQMVCIENFHFDTIPFIYMMVTLLSLRFCFTYVEQMLNKYQANAKFNFLPNATFSVLFWSVFCPSFCSDQFSVLIFFFWKHWHGRRDPGPFSFLSSTWTWRKKSPRKVYVTKIDCCNFGVWMS